MSNPPQEPGAGPPRLRARARTGTGSIRPEVADALGSVERSLGDVARWEQLLAGRPDLAGATPEAIAAAMGTTEVPFALEDVVAAPTLLTEFGVTPGAEGGGPDDTSVLWSARTVGTAGAGAALSPQDAALLRRRRNGRILSWAGVVVLVAVAALWFIPDRGDNDDADTGVLPTVDVTTTTRVRTSLLTTTVPSLAPADTVPADEVTTTTRRTTGTTRPRSSGTTPTTQSPTSTLGLPGTTPTTCQRPCNPGTTPTTQPPPTTQPTSPPTTAPTTTVPFPSTTVPDTVPNTDLPPE